jgi:hypothetical protein
MGHQVSLTGAGYPIGPLLCKGREASRWWNAAERTHEQKGPGPGRREARPPTGPANSIVNLFLWR